MNETQAVDQEYEQQPHDDPVLAKALGDSIGEEWREKLAREPGEIIPTGEVETRVKSGRRAWRQADVANLVTAFHRHPELGFNAEERAKLIELGLVSKPERPTLTDKDREALDMIVDDLAQFGREKQVLIARYLTKRLSEFLPKRAKRDEDADGIVTAGFLKPAKKDGE